MPSPDPREEAWRILRRVEETGAWASALLERAEAALDPRDAGLLHELVLGVLRRRSALDHALQRASTRPPSRIDPAVREALRLGAYSLLHLERVPAHAAVATAVDLVRRHAPPAAGFANAVLRRIAREGRDLLPPAPREGDVAALARAGSHPVWWTRRLVERRGWEAAAALLEADNQPAPTVLRANTRRIAAPDLAVRLRAEGVETEPGRRAPHALRVTAGRFASTAAFREGLAWVQDEAGQAVADLAGGPHAAVLDLCAAPGGKALALATVADRVIAADLSPARLRRVEENRARTGLPVLPVAADARTPPFAGTFDAVLVDAPCTGTGTMRRHPEIRWSLRPGDVARAAGVQAAILARGADLVRPGGVLVYAVCSLEPEEGEGVVAGFLEGRPGFALEATLATAPGPDGLDGFQAARLVRRSGLG